MSIVNNKKDLKEALKKAYKKYPRKDEYSVMKHECIHFYDKEIYNDGKYKIYRCEKWGDEKIVRVEKDELNKKTKEKIKVKEKGKKNK